MGWFSQHCNHSAQLNVHVTLGAPACFRPLLLPPAGDVEVHSWNNGDRGTTVTSWKNNQWTSSATNRQPADDYNQWTSSTTTRQPADQDSQSSWGSASDLKQLVLSKLAQRYATRNTGTNTRQQPTKPSTGNGGGDTVIDAGGVAAGTAAFRAMYSWEQVLNETKERAQDTTF
jgi:hypothetical protein